MSFPRNASAAAKMAMSWGILVSLADRNGAAILQASPKEIKKKLCNSGSASKEDVEAAASVLYPNAPDLLTGLPAGVRNHAYDALAAVYTCLDTEFFRLVLSGSPAAYR
jgi:Holliday junction resolvasome RuvABC endonuclease subunit